MSYSSPVFKIFKYLTDSTYTKHNFELHRITICKKGSRVGFVTSNAHPIGTAPRCKYSLGHMRRERTCCHVKFPSRTGTHPTPVKHPSPAQSLNTFW